MISLILQIVFVSVVFTLMSFNFFFLCFDFFVNNRRQIIINPIPFGLFTGLVGMITLSPIFVFVVITSIVIFAGISSHLYCSIKKFCEIKIIDNYY